MHFVILCVALFCLLTNLDFAVDSAHTDAGLELLFRQRSHSDWKDVWHQETHSRCRDKLFRHLYWACENDIYRLTRRSGPKTMITPPPPINRVSLYLGSSKWLGKTVANTFLRSRHVRRASGPSITRECCTKVGCTWEEYAEYCPANKRRNHF